MTKVCECYFFYKLLTAYETVINVYEPSDFELDTDSTQIKRSFYNYYYLSSHFITLLDLDFRKISNQIIIF